MSKAKKHNPLAPTAKDRCHHENDADNPNLVREFVHSDGVSVFAVRQCSLCNTTAQRIQPKGPGPAIEAFYDWDSEAWEPISKHAAYQDRQAAKVIKGPDEPTDIIEG